LLLFLLTTLQAQTVEKLWETDSIVAVPESVLPVSAEGLLYISLIDGAPWEADGRGRVARMKADGSHYDSTWVKGLNAPKGMGLYGNRLYVADISDVVVIDTKTAKILQRIPIEGASGLNDITVTDKGIVYVSDSKTARIWRLVNNSPSLFLEGMQGVNGLKASGETLLILSGKSFIKADASKNITKIAELPQGGDGVEPVGNGDYLVSAWAGYLFYVAADGTVKTILETAPQKRNTADIGFDPVQRIIYVPTFFAKTIAAYKLK
jgi:hypothetical protein